MAGILFARQSTDEIDPSYPEIDVGAIFEAHGAVRVARAAAAGYSYIDVNSNVNWATLEPHISTYGFELFFHSGHGSSRVMAGDWHGSGYYHLISEDVPATLNYFSGKAVYSMSCNTANSLLYTLSTKGAIAVAGYSEAIGFTMLDGALDDQYYISTTGGCFKFLESVIDGNLWADAELDAIAEWNTQYAYWTTGDGASLFGASWAASLILGQKNSFSCPSGLSGYYTFKLASPTTDTGTINVSTDNAGASFTITGPATYSGTGTSWSQANAPIGSYTIAYGAIAGYTTPAQETIVLTVGGAISFSGVYVAVVSDGTITVSTNNSGAAFTIVGPETFSGTGTSYTTTEAAPGSYIVTFSAVSGYLTPSTQTKTVNAGQVTAFTGTYTAIPAEGTINASTNLDSASFNITGPTSYAGTGKAWSVATAPIGTYTISFGAVLGYNTPTAITGVVASGGTLAFSGIYTAQVMTGSVSVSANIANATYTIAGAASLSGSGISSVFYNAPAGSYTITYGTVAGYAKPSSETQTLAEGGSITFTGTYVQAANTGTIVVNTDNASASWTLTGAAYGNTYTGSGTSWAQLDVVADTYSIAFGNIAGYATPTAPAQTLVAGSAIAFTVSYPALATSGTIAVTTNTALATFTIVGSNTYSGTGRSYSVSSAPVGTYTITYGEVAGFVKPSSQVISLSASGSIAFIGNYNPTSSASSVSSDRVITTVGTGANIRETSSTGLVRSISDPKGYYRVDNTPTIVAFAGMPCLPSMPVDAHINSWEFKSLYGVNVPNVWTSAQYNIGSPLVVQNERGGVAKVITAEYSGSYYFYLSIYEIAKLQTGKGLWLNTRFKVDDTVYADWFIGLCKRLETGANLFDNRIDAIGFYGSNGSASINAECRKGFVASQTAGIGSLVDDEFAHIHIYADGVNRIYFYINGVYQTQIKTNLPDTEEMCFAFGIRNGKREANEFTIGYTVLIQDR